jgi:hypothetical protein
MNLTNRSDFTRAELCNFRRVPERPCDAGLYTDSIPEAKLLYDSVNWQQYAFWAAAWLHTIDPSNPGYKLVRCSSHLRSLSVLTIPSIRYPRPSSHDIASMYVARRCPPSFRPFGGEAEARLGKGVVPDLSLFFLCIHSQRLRPIETCALM